MNLETFAILILFSPAIIMLSIIGFMLIHLGYMVIDSKISHLRWEWRNRNNPNREGLRNLQNKIVQNNGRCSEDDVFKLKKYGLIPHEPD